ncbi:hypothetical protein [Leclercia adecarboxylata]|uniref:hypothetical protein n=1 Tax=Leclercia adecarboxylata TaxID=83655 RepID=UPI003016BB85
MIQIARVIEIDEMAKAINETVEVNKNHDTTRLEWFAEFGYGDDFEGYSHPTEQQVSDIGTVRPVSDSEQSRVVDGVLLNFTTVELMQKLAIDDLVDAVNTVFKGEIPDDLYVHSERGYPVVEYMFENKHGCQDCISIEVHPDPGVDSISNGFAFIANVDVNEQSQYFTLLEAAKAFEKMYNYLQDEKEFSNQQEQEYEAKPKSFGM